ncbi:MAG: PIG-L deacetylase family protein [Blastomonas sp.]
MSGHLSARSLSARPWRDLRWLVIAPHPDDETLGAGALIHQTAHEKRLAGIAYLTDGSGSHPASAGRRLISARKREAALALRRLVGGPIDTLHLGWRDASPAQPGDALFDRTCRRLAALCEARQVDAIAVTALHEPHCDHAAAARLAYAVRDASRRSLRVAEYIVWAEQPLPLNGRRFRTQPMPAGLRRHALAAHRSQTGASHGPGFRLPRAFRRMPAIDILYHTGE